MASESLAILKRVLYANARKEMEIYTSKTSSCISIKPKHFNM